MNYFKTDICVLGGGSAGLSLAAGAVQMGAKVILVEPGPMGGDCLNYGCVPSKALIAAAHCAYEGKTAHQFGIEFSAPEVNFAQVIDHVQNVIHQIEPHDSIARFESLGVQVITEKGHFLNAKTLQAGKNIISAKYFAIATGSSAWIPPISGLDQVSYLTNETIFSQREFMPELLIMGGGPIGMEMAQAFQRLGSKVHVLEMSRCLARHDSDCAAVVIKQCQDEGVNILEHHEVQKVEKLLSGRIVVHMTHEGKAVSVSGTHLLVAVGRRPVLKDLGLDLAQIQYDAKGIKTDSRLRTNRQHIFALGDVIGHYQFTHTAEYHAGIALKNMLFRLRAKTSYHAMPSVTYTDPEIARVGLSEEEARTRFGEARVKSLILPFSRNDRALAERKTLGQIKLIVHQRGRALGVEIVGSRAGELLLPWQMLVAKGGKVSEIAGSIVSYPTRSEVSKRVAGQFFTPMIFSAKVKKIVRFLLKMP